MPSPAHRDLLDPAVLARLGRLAVQARRPMLGSVTGLHRSATRGSSVEFAEYRKYAPGDDPRHLDWRVYARTDRFYMKEFDADTNLRCILFLDLSGSMGYANKHGSKLDFAKRMAATLAYLLIKQGDAVGLWLAGEHSDRELPARRSPAHLRLLMDVLHTATPQGENNLMDSLHRAADRIRRRALIIVLSDFFTDPEPLLRAFRHMRFQHHDLALFHVLDPQELAFDFDRPIRFVDLERTHTLISDPSQTADAYRAEIGRYLDELQRGSREFQADYQRVMMHTGFEKALASFILRRQQGGGG